MEVGKSSRWEPATSAAASPVPPKRIMASCSATVPNGLEKDESEVNSPTYDGSIGS